MDRGRKRRALSHTTVSLWTTDARTARDVHDLDRMKVAPAASGARKQVSCRATSSLSSRNELSRIVLDRVANSEINSANAKRHFVRVFISLPPRLAIVTATRHRSL
jgi:hypothetical protein